MAKSTLIYTKLLQDHCTISLTHTQTPRNRNIALLEAETHCSFIKTVSDARQRQRNRTILIDYQRIMTSTLRRKYSEVQISSSFQIRVRDGEGSSRVVGPPHDPHDVEYYSRTRLLALTTLLHTNTAHGTRLQVFACTEAAADHSCS